jgi:hypothetical protein
LALTTTFSAVVSNAQDAAPPDEGAPATSAPSSAPTTIPAPPAPPAAAAAEPAPAGQWTYTNEYGWIWTPYAQSYTYVADGSDMAYSYVYYPAFGWRWVSSPWVLGVGPAPYWGVRGRVGFAWYAHPWFHGAYGGGGYHGYRGGSYRANSHVAAHVAVGGGFHGGGFHGGGHGRR